MWLRSLGGEMLPEVAGGAPGGTNGTYWVYTRESIPADNRPDDDAARPGTEV